MEKQEIIDLLEIHSRGLERHNRRLEECEMDANEISSALFDEKERAKRREDEIKDYVNAAFAQLNKLESDIWREIHRFRDAEEKFSGIEIWLTVLSMILAAETVVVFHVADKVY